MMANKQMKKFLSALIIKEMQIHTTKRYQVAPTGMATIKKKEGRKGKNENCACLVRRGKNWNPWALLARMWMVQLNSIEALQKIKNRITIWPSNFTSRNIPKRTESRSWIYTCTFMFTEVLFTTANTGKQFKCPSAGEWIIKMCYI